MLALKPSQWEWTDWSVLLSASCRECSRLPCRSVEDMCCWAREGEACCNRNTCTVINRYFYFIAKCIREKTGAQNIVKEIKQYQEKWLQHIQRIDTNMIPKQALQYKPKRRRHIGRPRKKWRDQFHFEDKRNRNQT